MNGNGVRKGLTPDKGIGKELVQEKEQEIARTVEVDHIDEIRTTQQQDFLKVLGLVSDHQLTVASDDTEEKRMHRHDTEKGKVRPGARSTSNGKDNGSENENSTNDNNNNNRDNITGRNNDVNGNGKSGQDRQTSGWRCINIPFSLYCRVRALGYYLTLSGDGSTVSMAQAIDCAISAYADADSDAGRFLEKYRD